MDLTRDVIYRGYLLNAAAIVDNIVAGNGAGGGISGCVIDNADFTDVDVVQFLEKRSLQDGMDAGDVYLGARRVRMAGTLYGLTRADLFDRMWELRAILSPVLAQREEPQDHGFRPLYFSTPTNRISDYPLGAIDFRLLCMPRAEQNIFQRDQLGGDDLDALAIPWQSTFIMRDPTIYASLPQTYDISAGGVISGEFINRGTYLSTLNMILPVGTAAGTITFAYEGATMTITVPASSNDRIIRYKGADKVLTSEELGVELPKMNLLTSTSQNTHPLVVPGVVDNDWVLTYNGVTPTVDASMWFWESYA